MAHLRRRYGVPPVVTRPSRDAPGESTGSTSGRPTLPMSAPRFASRWSTLDGEQPPRSGHTLELVLTAVVELDAGTNNQISHRRGHEHLAGAGEGRHPGADVHRHAGDVGATALDLAG